MISLVFQTLSSLQATARINLELCDLTLEALKAQSSSAELEGHKEAIESLNSYLFDLFSSCSGKQHKQLLEVLRGFCTMI